MQLSGQLKKLFLPLGLLLFVALFCQSSNSTLHLGVDEGLSQGSVFEMVQDEQGFLWISTADGLNRFDGNNFRLFRSEANDSSPVMNAQLRNLYLGKDAIWITPSSKMQIFRFDLLSHKIKMVYSDSADVRNREVKVFHEDGDTLWLLNSARGVQKYIPATQQVTGEFPEMKNCMPSVNCVSYDTATSTLWSTGQTADKLCSFNIATSSYREKIFTGSSVDSALPAYAVKFRSPTCVWVATMNGIIEYNPERDTFAVHHIPYNPEIPDRIVSLSCMVGNKMWCGSEKGAVYVFDASKNSFVKNEEVSAGKNNLARRTISFMLDRSMNMWIGTDPDGLFKVDTKEKPFHHIQHEEANGYSLRNNFIKCFLVSGNEVYAGLYNNGISVMNKETGKHRFINGFNNQATDLPTVTAMTESASGRIWVSTSQGLGCIEPGQTYLTRPKEFTADPHFREASNTVLMLNENTLLIGCDTGMYKLTFADNSSAVTYYPLQTRVEKLTLDSKGNLWVGSMNGVFFSRGGDPSNLQLHFNTLGRGKCITETTGGTIWIGTENGLFKVDPATLKVERAFTEKDGLPNSFVYGMLEDAKHNLWLSTNKGISCLNPATEVFRNYSVSDGLQSNEFNTGAYYKSADGELFFGGVNGFNYFRPEEISDNPFPAQCAITGFSVFDEPLVSDTVVERRKHIILDYSQNNLLIEYAATEFTDPSKNKFMYRLAGLDTNWVLADKERFARFINVDPGDYTFQLKAANNDGLWNDSPLELRITITPPFWKTMTFIVSVSVITLLLLILSVRFYFRRRLKQKTRELELKQSVRINAIFETEENERKRIAGELHDGLGQLLSTAKLNVSGIGESAEVKNSVLYRNSIQLLDQACEEVRNISHNMMPGALIRMGLMAGVNELIIKINDAGKIKVEFETNLEERLDEHVEISVYRVIQEALNNMVKHAEAKNIVVNLMRNGSTLEAKIADDGKGFDVSRIAESKGLGWKNMNSRIETLHGTMHVESTPGKGTSITITVPLKGT